jgi:membrane protease YdiL (CAAX protease family)
MHRIRSAISQHPIAAYIILAAAISWPLTALVSVSVAFGLLALFGPATAAIIVSWADGTVGELRTRIGHWRVSPRLYAAALGIPFAVAAVGAVIHIALGGGIPGLGSIGAIEAVIFVLVVGEEIGWRGFLMPRLRAKVGLAEAGLITGVVWTLWHLPMYLTPAAGLGAFAVFAWWVIPMAVVIGAVAEGAGYSVIVATVMHGAANIATPILLPGVDRTWTLVVTGAMYLVLAVGIAARARRSVAAAARTPDREATVLAVVETPA